MKIREIIKLDVDNMNCIVISHPEFKQLAKDTGIPIYELDYLVAKWQDKNNIFGRFPSKDELKEGINFSFKTTKIVSNNLDRIESLWKQLKDTDVFWNKIQKDFGIPKEQLVLFRESEGNTIKDKLIDFISKYSYNIQVKTATQESDKRGVYAHPHFTLENGDEYVKYGENDYEFYPKGDRTNSKVISKETYEAAKPKVETFTSHYSHMTVPGGTNYTENEIITPEITPSIKGHAQFATDKGIGWFRSDDKLRNKEITVYDKSYNWEGNHYSLNTEGTKAYRDGIQIQVNEYLRLKNIAKADRSTDKTRRILEVQSDLFQKGRDREILAGLEDKRASNSKVFEKDGFKYAVSNKNGKEVYEKASLTDLDGIFYKWNEINKEDFLKELPANFENNFLQLLNKDNNWITFFIKSIIQDSAKKGYEKVLFPTGNTASKVEGHTTLEEFKKQKEDRIKELEEKKKTASNNKPWLVSEITNNKKYYFNTEEEANEFRKTNGIENFYSAVPTSSLKDSLKNIEDINNEINQLKQELERIEIEGFGALKPIYNFYETVVKNILKKNYQVNSITDEYGNTWNEINLHEAPDTILAALGEKGITKQEFDSLTAEEKRHLIHQLFNC